LASRRSGDSDAQRLLPALGTKVVEDEQAEELPKQLLLHQVNPCDVQSDCVVHM